MNENERPISRKCKLDDGRIMDYDAMSSRVNAYGAEAMICIGHGCVYSIDGVTQGGTVQGFFFVWLKK